MADHHSARQRAYSKLAALHRDEFADLYAAERLVEGLHAEPQVSGRHGRRGRYDKGCRCAACTNAKRAETAQRRQRGLPPDDERHGTLNGYSHYGCRCEPCCLARKEYSRRRRAAARDAP